LGQGGRPPFQKGDLLVRDMNEEIEIFFTDGGYL